VDRTELLPLDRPGMKWAEEQAMLPDRQFAHFRSSRLQRKNLLVTPEQYQRPARPDQRSGIQDLLTVTWEEGPAACRRNASRSRPRHVRSTLAAGFSRSPIEEQGPSSGRVPDAEGTGDHKRMMAEAHQRPALRYRRCLANPMITTNCGSCVSREREQVFSLFYEDSSAHHADQGVKHPVAHS